MFYDRCFDSYRGLQDKVAQLFLLAKLWVLQRMAAQSAVPISDCFPRLQSTGGCELHKQQCSKCLNLSSHAFAAASTRGCNLLKFGCQA